MSAEGDIFARILAGVASYQGLDGLGPDWTDDGGEPEAIAALVLDALGLEQVGWMDGSGTLLTGNVQSHHYTTDPRLRPVYQPSSTDRWPES